MENYQIFLRFTNPYIGSCNGGNRVWRENLTLKEARNELLRLFNEHTDYHADTWSAACLISKSTSKRHTDNYAWGGGEDAKFEFDSRVWEIRKPKMKKYNINIKLADGNEINAAVAADNEFHALKRVMIDEHKRFAVVSIKEIRITPADAPDTIERSRFYLLELYNGWYKVIDIDNDIEVIFLAGTNFKTRMTKASERLTALQTATALREITDYIYEYHRDLL